MQANLEVFGLARTRAIPFLFPSGVSALGPRGHTGHGLGHRGAVKPQARLEGLARKRESGTLRPQDFAQDLAWFVQFVGLRQSLHQ